MAELINIIGETRKQKYESLIPQLKALVEGEKDLIANISNIMSGLKYGMDFFWVGIYFASSSEALAKDGQGDELILGPFQGTVACTRIKKGKGVCGTCWEKKETMIVNDVAQFPGHIACSANSRSEIVIPIMKAGEVFAVLDVDSDKLNDFTEVDKIYLKEVASLIEKLI